MLKGAVFVIAILASFVALSLAQYCAIPLWPFPPSTAVQLTDLAGPTLQYQSFPPSLANGSSIFKFKVTFYTLRQVWVATWINQNFGDGQDEFYLSYATDIGLTWSSPVLIYNYGMVSSSCLQ